MANPFPFTSGQILTAEQMNSIGEAGTVYTPTVSALGGVATSLSATAKYVRINKLLFISFTITCTTAGTAVAGFNLSMPPGITSTLALGTGVGINRENNVTGSFGNNAQNTATNIWVICVPGNGTSFVGTLTTEVA
jgi:hypothetical protein